METRLKLSSDDCNLLYQLKTYGSLTAICEELKIDKGFLSRKLSRMTSTSDVLEKVSGKWTLTSKGEALVDCYGQFIVKQNEILSDQIHLSIGSTPLVSERRIIPRLTKLKESLGLDKIIIKTGFTNLEQSLLSNQIDCLITCSIPKTPEIRYKKIFKSPLVIVTPSSWKDTPTDYENLLKLCPYVSHVNMNFRLILGVEQSIPEPIIEFDNLLCIRQAVSEGLGWSILPLYAIGKEISEGTVSCIHNIKKLSSEDFQLWWVPGRLNNKTISILAGEFS